MRGHTNVPALRPAGRQPNGGARSLGGNHEPATLQLPRRRDAQPPPRRPAARTHAAQLVGTAATPRPAKTSRASAALATGRPAARANATTSVTSSALVGLRADGERSTTPKSSRPTRTWPPR